MSQKQVMPKSEDLSRSLEINAIWTFDTEFPTIFNKSMYYIVPHEVKNQRAIAKRTSQIMQIGQDVIIQMERCIISKMRSHVVLGAPDSQHTLSHA